MKTKNIKFQYFWERSSSERSDDFRSSPFLIEHLPDVVLEIVEDLEVDGQVPDPHREGPEQVGHQLCVKFVLVKRKMKNK
jgi:hypothetical protein